MEKITRVHNERVKMRATFLTTIFSAHYSCEPGQVRVYPRIDRSPGCNPILYLAQRSLQRLAIGAGSCVHEQERLKKQKEERRNRVAKPGLSLEELVEGWDAQGDPLGLHTPFKPKS